MDWTCCPRFLVKSVLALDASGADSVFPCRHGNRKYDLLSQKEKYPRNKYMQKWPQVYLHREVGMLNLKPPPPPPPLSALADRQANVFHTCSKDVRVCHEQIARRPGMSSSRCNVPSFASASLASAATREGRASARRRLGTAQSNTMYIS